MLRDQELFPFVTDHIQHNSFSWNKSALHRVYDQQTANIIASYPISVTGARDRLLWTCSADVMMTLRKGLQVALSCTSINQTCTIVLFKEHLATLLTSGYRRRKNLQVIGLDVNNLLHQFSSYNICFLSSPAVYNSLSKLCNNGLTVGWTLL
ncbi:uncharacterized protein G2W53_009582 [Senna tora]|uniref:Uncharacterized protein n=1 Tax=Senna tora TaxID=362788 RepID=A0A834WYP7_9FABA|nr:uncharacterized protein G2W53_009582 [Senna tora]